MTAASVREQRCAGCAPCVGKPHPFTVPFSRAELDRNLDSPLSQQPRTFRVTITSGSQRQSFTITIPNQRTAWQYLQAASGMRPGATDAYAQAYAAHQAIVSYLGVTDIKRLRRQNSVQPHAKVFADFETMDATTRDVQVTSCNTSETSCVEQTVPPPTESPNELPNEPLEPSGAGGLDAGGLDEDGLDVGGFDGGDFLE